MSDTPKSSGANVAILILAIVGLANWAYAGYRYLDGRTDNAPLMIAGMASLTLALILRQRARAG